MADRRTVGLASGILIAFAIFFIPFQGLSVQGRECLSLTLMTVIFWAFQVAQAGYVSGLLLALMVVLKVAEPSVVFGSWTGSTMFLIIGAYLIASAVRSSGLGERIAYWFILHLMHSYRSIIVAVFCITFVLSLIIPHPWPRAFLIMSVMAEVIENGKIPKPDAIKIGYAVFAASVPVSMIFLTGDCTINPLVAQYAGMELSWTGWLRIMGPPGVAASAATCAGLLLTFHPSQPVVVDRETARRKLKAMGWLSGREIHTIVWLSIAVALWMTDGIHKIDAGWITLLISMLMAMPVAGELLSPKSWNEVPVQVLLFITAAMAIGRVGTETGMNRWIATNVLPSSIPSNPFLLAAFVVTAAVLIHMLLGSVIAVMGVAIPAILACTGPLSINPLVPAFWVLTAVNLHYVFPFQNMSILVGLGEENGMYSQRETIRFSLPLLAITFVTVLLVEVPWWKFLGLL